jgi:hypothetical protein
MMMPGAPLPQTWFNNLHPETWPIDGLLGARSFADNSGLCRSNAGSFAANVGLRWWIDAVNSGRELR